MTSHAATYQMIKLVQSYLGQLTNNLATGYKVFIFPSFVLFSIWLKLFSKQVFLIFEFLIKDEKLVCCQSTLISKRND